MMLQFISIIIDTLPLFKQILYLQRFSKIKIFLRKPCSYDFVTLRSKLIHKMNQF